MANAVYPKGLEAYLGGDLDWDTNTIKVTFCTTGYAYSSTHEFLTSVAATARLGTSTALGSKTKASGVADAADIATTTLTLSTMAMKRVVVFADSGSSGTSRLLVFIDTGTNLPLGAGTTKVQTLWASSGIFKL